MGLSAFCSLKTIVFPANDFTAPLPGTNPDILVRILRNNNTVPLATGVSVPRGLSSGLERQIAPPTRKLPGEPSAFARLGVSTPGGRSGHLRGFRGGRALRPVGRQESGSGSP